jgi:hypothetical protein
MSKNAINQCLAILDPFQTEDCMSLFLTGAVLALGSDTDAYVVIAMAAFNRFGEA